MAIELVINTWLAPGETGTGFSDSATSVPEVQFGLDSGSNADA